MRLIRERKLAKNHSAGRCDAMHLRSVHHRPPKNMAPSPSPAAHDRKRVDPSFIVRLPLAVHGLLFVRDPVPSVETADRKPGHQQHQGP